MGTTLIFPASGKVVKTIPFWIKCGERGKVRGAEFYISSMEKGDFSGGWNFSDFRGREIGPVVANRV